MKIKLNKKEYDVKQHKLKNWLISEEIRGKLSDTAKEGDIKGVCNNVFSYIEKAISVEIPQNLPWYDVAQAFISIANLNVPHLIPILLGKINPEREAWEYDGRLWFMWANTFAQCYGWDLNRIATMDINDAVSLLQEIALQKQYDREWQWSLTEIAYPYNESSNRSEFHPLTRPDWMQMSVKPIVAPKKKWMAKEMMPMGLVMGMNDVVSE